MGGVKHQEPPHALTTVCMPSVHPHKTLSVVSTPSRGALLDAYPDLLNGGVMSWLRCMQITDRWTTLMS